MAYLFNNDKSIMPLENCFKIVKKSDTIAITAGTNAVVNYDVSLPGYTPVAITSFDLNLEDVGVYFQEIRIRPNQYTPGTYGLNILIANTKTSTKNVTFNVRILYVKAVISDQT